MKLSQGVAAILLVAAGAAAQAEVTATVTATSDYDFRGITQSANDPALQASVDYAHESGFYAGVWASNVDWDADGDVEVDLYGGIAGGETVLWDVGLVWYAYPSSDDLYDFGELYGSLGYEWIEGKIWYSNKFGGCPNCDSAFYYEANANFELPAGFGLGLHIGRSDGDYWENFEYTDWSVGVTYTLGHFDLGLKYVDGSDLGDFCEDVPGDVGSCEARAIFSVSTTFPWSAE
ncbi:MAG: TorF family putative porin [Steroidobacteraceae bacterium]